MLPTSSCPWQGAELRLGDSQEPEHSSAMGQGEGWCGSCLLHIPATTIMQFPMERHKLWTCRYAWFLLLKLVGALKAISSPSRLLNRATSSCCTSVELCFCKTLSQRVLNPCRQQLEERFTQCTGSPQCWLGVPWTGWDSCWDRVPCSVLGFLTHKVQGWKNPPGDKQCKRNFSV